MAIKASEARICLGSALFIALSAGTPACAADFGAGPAGPAPAFPSYASGYFGYFNPLYDPRCRIVPMPEADLYGDTARFRPTAVCQSRGLYADSVLFP
ncbi:MAG: hypothetical protein J2P49_05510 [Methylocapsa sp.]|nr:hypothetical protein [Methylocapsa sp.]